jgi:hypothetical protein
VSEDWHCLSEGLALKVSEEANIESEEGPTLRVTEELPALKLSEEEPILRVRASQVCSIYSIQLPPYFKMSSLLQLNSMIIHFHDVHVNCRKQDVHVRPLKRA